MIIKVIKTEKENEKVLSEIALLMDKNKLTKEESERLELLYLLVENFEEKAYVLPDLDPVEAIKEYMELRGFTRADLTKELGDRAKVSQVLNKKRKLSLTMIRNLVEHWNMSAEVLLKQYPLST